MSQELTTDTLLPDPILNPPYKGRETRLVRLCEQGWVPDTLLRMGIRYISAQRLKQDAIPGSVFADQLRNDPVAIHTDSANEQHYELPAAFFHAHLGARKKYSCCWYSRFQESLDQAEIAMLELYAERAELADGQRILDLGCGWGSFGLWAAQRYPNSHVTGLSNSNAQRAYILEQAHRLNLNNIEIVTGDVSEFEFADGQAGFDRVVSVEMFEHMKNYGVLLAKIARWLRPDGRLFVHHFSHKNRAYHYRNSSGNDWMARYFFTGGTMPSHDLLSHFNTDMRVVKDWWVNGTHYERTSNQWLQQLDAAKAEVMPILVSTYGPDHAALWFQRWRMFYMAVAEMFGLHGGSEWGVSHLLLQARGE